MAAVKPVLVVDVDDSAFKRFYDLFEKYSAEVDGMPESWRTLNEAMGGAGKALSEGALTAKESLAVAAAQAGIISEALRDAVKEQNALGSATQNTGKRMQGLAQGARDVGKAISFVGGWIVRLGALGGLGGLLSGLGIADLAGAAYGRYRQSSGLGISPGALASFQVNAQQFLDTRALEGAVNAQVDITKAGALAALGINYADALRANPLALPFTELLKARELYLKAKPGTQKLVPGLSDATLGALGLNFDEVRRAANTPLSELLSARNRTLADQGSLGFDRQTAQAWANLKITLDKAGLTIQTALINSLAPLAPEIATLAKDVAGFISTFVNSKDFGIIVNDVKVGLRDMGTFLQRVDWQKIGSEINWFAEKVGWLIPQQKSTKSDPNNPWNKYGWDPNNPVTVEWWKHIGGALVGGGLQFGSDFSKELSQSWLGKGFSYGKDLVNAAKTAGLSPVLLGSLVASESGGNPKALSRTGAIGLTQLEPETAKALGVNPNDPAANLLGGATYLSEMIKHYKGNMTYALMAYNAGPGAVDQWLKGNKKYAYVGAGPASYAHGIEERIITSFLNTVDDDVKKHGRNWMRYLPKDVASFVSSAHLSASEKASTNVAVINKALRRALTQHNARTTKVAIKVHNPTQARVTAQVNAVSTAQ